MADENIFSTLNELLNKTDLSKVTSEGVGDFENLPDGLYYTELEKIEEQISKSSGNPMVMVQFRILEDGQAPVNDKLGNPTLVNIPKTKGKSARKYYVLKDEGGLKRFVSDMLKFEKPDGPLLVADYFTTEEKFKLALTLLQTEKPHIYINLETQLKKDVPAGTPMNKDNSDQWLTVYSWKRAKALGLK